MAYQGREPRYQQPPSQYSDRSDNYARQNNDYRQAQYNDQVYTQNHYDQQWQQTPQRQQYASNQQYSQAYEYEDDGRYAQDVNGYHDPRYAQQQYQEEYAPQSQPQQVRQYQYDDRYREDGRAAQSQARVGGQTAGGRLSPNSQPRPGTSASNHRLKQDRILDKAESPKTLAWDNPFGAFPGTKKDAEKKKKEADESRSQSRAEIPAGRPSTSASNRKPVPASSKQSLEEPRPQGFQNQQQQPANLSRQSYDQPLSPQEEMPLRKKSPTEYHEDYGQYGPPIAQPSRSQGQVLPMRPAVQRANTGPLPEPSPISPDVRSMPQNMGRHSSENQRVSNPRSYDASNQYAEGTYDNSHEQRQPEQRHRQADPTTYIAPPNSRSRPSRDRPPPNAYAPDYPSQNSYRSPQGAPGSNNISDHRLSDRVPVFEINDPNPGYNVDRELGLQTGSGGQEPKPQIYRKPTYGDMESRPPPVRPGLASPTSAYPNDSSSVSTPTGGFDFGLPLTESSSAPTPRNERPRQINQDQGYPVQQQFPPRNGSRQPPQPQRPTNGFSHPYNQPPRRQEPGARPQTANAASHGPLPPRQEYGFDDQGYPQQYSRNGEPPHPDQYSNGAGRRNDPQGNRQLARTYTEPVGPPGDERYNHGYEQRQAFEASQKYQSERYAPQQPRADSMRASQEPGFDRAYETPPPRPRTANSGRPPPQQYNSQPMPGLRQPHSNYAIADRNHPVPIRPGLMEQQPVRAISPAPAPPSQQISPPRNLPSSNQHRRQPSEASTQKSVTIQELNELRNAFKERPDDNKLGLKFAKRLVEAGNVLASEGGRADPKTTAKNRERYINDAFRTVKKLVSNGSAEAMFYLADCYGQGQLGLEVNPKEAFQLYTSAAKLGHAQSTYRVAVCCELGPDGGGGTRRDHFKAVQFYKKAATLGDGPAMFKMGMILLKGLLGAQPNRREGISWLKRAAERADEENPHSLHELASLYENAQSTDVIIRDERYALQLYTEAANLGYKYAQWRLGSAYEYGSLGVQIDPRQSIGWYTRAAAQGEHQSEFALSGWYLTGSEPLLAQSDQEAYLWARKAASSGLSKAEYAMGYYTEVGIGCRSDIEEAKKWYFRAAAQSDSRAKERLEEIKRGGARKEKTKISRTNVGKQNEGECSVM